MHRKWNINLKLFLQKTVIFHSVSHQVCCLRYTRHRITCWIHILRLLQQDQNRISVRIQRQITAGTLGKLINIEYRKIYEELVGYLPPSYDVEKKCKDIFFLSWINLFWVYDDISPKKVEFDLKVLLRPSWILVETFFFFVVLKKLKKVYGFFLCRMDCF